MVKRLAVCPVLRNWDTWEVEQEDCTVLLTLAGGLGGGLFTVVLEAEGTRTVRRFLLPPARLNLPAWDGNAAVSGRGWGVLFHQGESGRTLTARVEDFRRGEDFEVHMALGDEGPMGVFAASGSVKLEERAWDFPLSQSVARLTRVRGGSERA